MRYAMISLVNSVGVIAAALLCTTVTLAQDLLLYEPFDYPAGDALNDLEDWTGSAPLELLQILNDDGDGDGGSSSLEVPGLTSEGGRLKSTQGANGSHDHRTKACATTFGGWNGNWMT